VNNLINPR